MSREDPQLKVRLPQELKDKITESASNLGRSINADVVARLEESFQSFTSNKIDFAHGYLIAFLRAQAAIYHAAIMDLGNAFQKEPFPDLLHEQTRYKILFNEINKLIKILEEKLLPFDSADNKDAILELLNNPKNLEE